MSARWVAATVAGFVLGGVALHSPGASSVGTSYLDADLSASLFGAILGTVVGTITGLLQLLALRARDLRVLVASVIAVATAHALADGAPAIWGSTAVAALSGIVASLAFAWATRALVWFAVVARTVAWTIGWLSGVAIAGVLGLTGGSTPEVWAAEHALIASVLGIAWGFTTSPLMRRILERNGLLAQLVRAQR